MEESEKRTGVVSDGRNVVAANGLWVAEAWNKEAALQIADALNNYAALQARVDELEAELDRRDSTQRELAEALEGMRDSALRKSPHGEDAG